MVLKLACVFIVTEYQRDHNISMQYTFQVGYNFFGSDHPELFGNYTGSLLTLMQVIHSESLSQTPCIGKIKQFGLL
jgi:hypothetical protein